MIWTVLVGRTADVIGAYTEVTEPYVRSLIMPQDPMFAGSGENYRVALFHARTAWAEWWVYEGRELHRALRRIT